MTTLELTQKQTDALRVLVRSEMAALDQAADELFDLSKRFHSPMNRRSIQALGDRNVLLGISNKLPNDCR